MTVRQTEQRTSQKLDQLAKSGRAGTGHPVERSVVLVILLLLAVGLGACNRDDGEEAASLPTAAPLLATEAPTTAPTPVPPTATAAATEQATETATTTTTVAEAVTATPTATAEPVTGQAQVRVQGEMNVRAGPSTDSPVVGAAELGEEFAITGKSEDGNWWQIEIDDQVGWIYAPYVTAVNSESVPVVDGDEMMAAKDAIVTVNGDMNVRGGPGTNFLVVGPATYGQEYAITGKNVDGDWWQIDYDGQAGWIYGPFVTAVDTEDVPVVTGDAIVPPAGPFVIVNGDMNVRGGPGTSHPVVGAATLGQEYPITGKNPEGDWWKIDLDGQEGWIFAPYVTAVNAENVAMVEGGEMAASEEPVVTINGDMNVREGPGTGYPRVGGATAGQEFSITGKNADGDWWQIDFESQNGWVFAPFVTATGAEEVPVVAAPAPPSTPTSEQQDSDPTVPGQRAVITNVVDGDKLDLRFEVGGEDKIRLFDINAPEVTGEVECYGRQASVFTNLFSGQTVGVESQGRDAFDRLLAYVWLEDGRLLNEELARQGYAVYNDDGNPGFYAARVRAAADLAQSEGAGLWSQCPVGAAPTPAPTPSG